VSTTDREVELGRDVRRRRVVPPSVTTSPAANPVPVTRAVVPPASGTPFVPEDGPATSATETPAPFTEVGIETEPPRRSVSVTAHFPSWPAGEVKRNAVAETNVAGTADPSIVSTSSEANPVPDTATTVPPAVVPAAGM
jgi:hypothetical protein